jgi:hypothetical protein
MKWTYGDNPLTSPADELRFLIGDTNPTDPLLSDGEVAYALSRGGADPAYGALLAGEALLLRFSAMVDESVGSVSISFSQRLGNLEKMLSILRMRLALTESMPYGGGLSKVDVANISSNPDRVPPRFTRDRLAAPGIIEGDYDETGTGIDPLLGQLP